MKRKRLISVPRVHDAELKDMPPEKVVSIRDQQSIDYWIALAQLH